MRLATPVVRFGLAAVFVISGVVKLADIPAFLNAVSQYQLLPPKLVLGLGIYLPWLEIAVGFALFHPRFLHGAALLISVLNLVFIAAMIATWHRGLDVSCGCFGPLDVGGLRAGIARDSLFLAAASALLLTSPTPARPCLQPAPRAG